MGKGIVKYRYVILAVFIALIAVSAAFLPTMINKVNYDLTSYLPDDYETSKGYAFLSETFNIHGDVEIGVTATHEEIAQAADEILKLEGVTNAVWAQYMEMLLDFGIYSANDAEFTEMYNIFTDALAKGAATVTEDGAIEYADGAECNWALLITMKYPPSSQEAIKVFGEIESILKNVAGEGNYAMSGMTEQANALYETVFDELWIYLVAAGIVVLVILALTTNSLMEPLILILTLAVSIIINLGTNAIFPSTSMITFAVTAILQLGLSMDYAIFLLHQYRDELRTVCDPKQALAAAIPKSAKAVASSALTTVVGFLALMCMQFEIGTDLGLSLAKGIICSLVTVILLQPCLMLMLDKARVKTQHKCLDFHFRAPIKRSIRDRGWVSLVFAVLFIPALIGSLTLSYTYVRFMPEPDTSNYTEDQLWNYSTAKELGNQVMIIVPNERVGKDGNPLLDENGDHVYYIAENYEFVKKLNELGAETVTLDGESVEKLSYKLGMYVMIPEGSTITYELLGNSISLTLEQVFDLVNDIFPIVESIDFNDLTTLTQEKLDALFAEAGKIISDDATFTLGGLTFTFAEIKAIAGKLIPVLTEIGDDDIMDHANAIVNAINEVRPDITLFDLITLYNELSGMETGDMQSQMAMFQSYVNGGYTMYTVGINPAIDFESQDLLFHGLYAGRARLRGSHSRRLQHGDSHLHRRHPGHTHLHHRRHKVPRAARRTHRVRHLDQPHHAIYLHGGDDQLHVLPRHHGGAAGRDGGLRHPHHHQVPRSQKTLRASTGSLSCHHGFGDVRAHIRPHHGGSVFQHLCGVLQPRHTGDDLPHRARRAHKCHPRHIRPARSALLCGQTDGRRTAHPAHTQAAPHLRQTPKEIHPRPLRERRERAPHTKLIYPDTPARGCCFNDYSAKCAAYLRTTHTSS